MRSVTLSPGYCAGTLIRTPPGEIPVEQLRIGDEVLTGSDVPRAIKWIGRRRVGGDPEQHPVLIRAGALGERMPARDLCLANDQAVLIHQKLFPCKLLLNGSSIDRCVETRFTDYFAIELDDHDIIFAEGARSETYVDCDNRELFQNASEFKRLYPGDTTPGWRFYAPRMEAGPVAERLQRFLARRAGLVVPFKKIARGPLVGRLDEVTATLISGWAFDPSQPDTPVSLDVFVNDSLFDRVIANDYRADLKEAGYGSGRYGFTLRFSPGLPPLRRHVVRVHRSFDGKPLANSPQILEKIPLSALIKDPQAMGSMIEGAAYGAQTQAELDNLLRGLLDEFDHLLKIASDGRDGCGSYSARLAARSKLVRRALVIDDLLPDLTRDAGSNAVVGHMEALQKLGYAVEFIPSQQLADRTDPPQVENLDVLWHLYPWVSSVEAVLRANGANYELVYLHRIGNAQAYAGLVRETCPNAQIIYSVADLHHVRFSREADLRELPMLREHASVMKQLELMSMRAADTVITHSQAEAAYLAKEEPRTKVRVVGWPVKPSPCKAAFSARNGVAFIGFASYRPNMDAVGWLVQDIMPLVWQQDPTVTCQIVGDGWSAVFKGTLDARIRLLGRVPKLATVFDQVRLTIAPLRFGAGVKGKVLDSIAAGIPCVMTPIAAEGIPLPDALRGLVGSAARELAVLVNRVHKDEELNASLAAASVEFIAHSFSLSRVTEDLRAALGPAQPKILPFHSKPD